MLLLVISTQPAVRDYLGNICRHFGYTVEFASGTRSQDELPRRLSDYGMILLDGIEPQFAESELALLREHAPASDVVLLCADDDAGGAQWKQQGARSVLQAPILPGRLKRELIRGASEAA